jgi:type VI secretion system secreted protein VgrG
MLFTLKDHYLAPENTKHIVISANFIIVYNQFNRSGSSSGDEYYECSFKAIRSTQQFRPQRLTPAPFVQGPQTATVVGKSGEEIWTDKYGRIKVQFHWERNGKQNETSSCWIRVAYPVAGKQWGWVSLPRIGQEVVVSFLEGNPDRPLITGSVYNANQMPPYTLPANQTQSGIKSRSSKEGVADNFNELRFEDKKGSEEVYFHAEKNFNCVIENNETRKIGLDKKDKGNQTLEIYNDRTATLKMGNDTLTVEKGNSETNIDTGNNTLNIKKGNYTTKIGLGDYKLDIDAGKATITAMTSIELKVGSNTIKLDQTGIKINGISVKIDATAKLDANSPLTTVGASAVLTLQGTLTKIN